MVDAVAYAGLGGQVNDRIERASIEGLGQRRSVLQAATEELERRIARELIQSRLFQPRIVVGVEVVEADYPRAVAEQSLSDMISYESR